MGVGRRRVGAAGTALPERGTPFGGHGGADAPPPILRLTPESETEARAALLGAGWWLGLLTAVWLLTLLPPVLRWTRPFWAEQLLLLGALGWYIGGPRPFTVALLAAWAAVRLVRVGRFGLMLWHGWTAAPSTAGSGASGRG